MELVSILLLHILVISSLFTFQYGWVLFLAFYGLGLVGLMFLHINRGI